MKSFYLWSFAKSSIWYHSDSGSQVFKHRSSALIVWFAFQDSIMEPRLWGRWLSRVGWDDKWIGNDSFAERFRVLSHGSLWLLILKEKPWYWKNLKTNLFYFRSLHFSRLHKGEFTILKWKWLCWIFDLKWYILNPVILCFVGKESLENNYNYVNIALSSWVANPNLTLLMFQLRGIKTS